MKTTTEPYVRDLEYRGFVEGLTIKDKHGSKSLCHYFGGIPYALPPVGPFRWQKPRPLPSCFRYGTRKNPGKYTAGTSLCPQPSPEDSLSKNDWDEDCLQLNIHMPAGEPPKGGWPVYFWIHGGFLQFGDPNGANLAAMFSETDLKAVFVMPAYRLNLFGFLCSREIYEGSNGTDLCANLGFWDQRLALEWTYKNVSYFGGDASNITIGGYSAGSHSTFHQLAYDLGVSDSKSIVRRACMHSNGPGLQPKSWDEAEQQFDELLTNLNIPLTLSSSEKLTKLRALSPETLLKASQRMKYHQFRGITDGSFVRHSLFTEIDNGIFATQMRRRGVQLLIGECRDEHFMYARWRPPKNSSDSLFRRLQADYPLIACEELMKYYFPDGKLPQGWRNWKDAFGRVYADIQIHALERGMVNALVDHGAGHLIHRYRIEWRAECVKENYPIEWGITHGTDMPIWFWGNGQDLKAKEKKIIKNAFFEKYTKYVNGEDVNWGTEQPLHVRTLLPDGSVVCEEDQRLDAGIKVWNILKDLGITVRPRL